MLTEDEPGLPGLFVEFFTNGEFQVLETVGFGKDPQLGERIFMNLVLGGFVKAAISREVFPVEQIGGIHFTTDIAGATGTITG